MRMGVWLALALVGAAGVLAGCGNGGPVAPVTLVVTSTPSGGLILVRDAKQPGGPVDTKQTTPADVKQAVPKGGTVLEVTVRLSGYDDATAQVTARPGDVVQVDLPLRPSQPPAVPPHTITGKVLLQGAGGGTTPAPDAGVVATDTTTNEAFTGTMDQSAERAGAYYIFAPPGTYRVTASRPGYQSQSREVTIMSGEDRLTGIDLTLPPG